VIAVFVFSNAGMEVIDDLPVLELPLLLVAPDAVLIQEKHGCFFGDDGFWDRLFHHSSMLRRPEESESSSIP
jgi:hypothetical protein